MSLVDTIKKHSCRSTGRAIRSSRAFAAVTLVLGFFSTSLFWIGLILTGWCAYFFRDPVRVTPLDDRLVISPADGVVSSVGPAIPPRELGLGLGEMTRISVFMNVFSCHVNRSPVRGKITRIEHRPGKFLNAELDKASSENERNGLVIDSPNGTSASSRSPAWWRAVSSVWSRPMRNIGGRRALRADPLRLAARRVPAQAGDAARGRSARRRSPARP